MRKDKSKLVDPPPPTLPLLYHNLESKAVMMKVKSGNRRQQQTATRARICKRLKSPRIDSKRNRVRQTGNRFLDALKDLQIRAQHTKPRRLLDYRLFHRYILRLISLK
jgi:hypothetical protein